MSTLVAPSQGGRMGGCRPLSPVALKELNDTKRHTNGETSCELCGYHYENCEHFLLHCTALQETRKNVIGLQQPFKESIDETISDFLLFKENSEEIINRNRDDLQKLWQHSRLTCAWQYFGTLIFELFFEIIRFYVDNINFLFLC